MQPQLYTTHSGLPLVLHTNEARYTQGFQGKGHRGEEWDRATLHVEVPCNPARLPGHCLVFKILFSEMMPRKIFVGELIEYH